MANRIVVVASGAVTLNLVVSNQNTAVAAAIAAAAPQVVVSVASDMDIAVNSADTVANFCMMDVLSYQS